MGTGETAECSGATNDIESRAQEGESDISAIAFSLQLDRFLTCTQLEEAEKEAKEWVKTYGVKAQVFQLSKTYVPGEPVELDVNTKEETDSSGNKADNKAYLSEEELEVIVPLYKQYGQYIKACYLFDSLKANKYTG